LNRCLVSLCFVGATLLATPGRTQEGDPWVIRAETGYETYAPVTLANGVYGMTFSEVPFAGNLVRLAGVFDVLPSRGTESSVAAVDFTPLELVVMAPDALESPRADFLKGRPLSAADVSGLEEWSQELNIREGWFETRFVFEGLELTHRAYALKHMLHTALVKVTIRAREDRAVAVRNRPRVGEANSYLRSRYLDQLRERRIPLFTVAASTPGGRHTLATTSSLVFEGDDAPALRYVDDGLGQPSLGFETRLEAGEALTFFLVGSMASSLDYSNPVNETARLNIFSVLEGPARLIRRHEEAWASFWQKTDITVDGRPDLTRGLRLALFMVSSFASEHTGFTTAAMGLGTDYWGWKALWDAEWWIWPAVLLVEPDVARAMLEYRYERLDMARRNAAAHGYGGAMFPWESGSTGEEETSLLYLTGPFQHHITADVGLAFWRYYCVSQDEAWLRERGYPVLREVAEFWLSRVDRTSDGRYAILNVVAPDEHAVGVDNDAFTNGVAGAVLRAAAEAARVLGETPDPRWLEVAKGLVLLRFPDGTVREHATYDGETIKQADVGLLSFPLDVVTDPDTVRKNLDYYTKKLDPRGPNMSRFMYAGAAARIGDRKRAARFFEEAYSPYLLKPFGTLALTARSTGNTYFGTSAGGLLQAVILGFGGLHFTAEGLVQKDPLLPEGWGMMTLRGIGRGQDFVTEASSRRP